MNDALATRLLAIFTDELDEQVQQLNEDLLALERAPQDAERLRGVFRVMHTLKGASRAAGLPLVEQLCHALETGLSRVRDQGAALGGAQVALLFEAADALGETRTALRAGLPIPETTLETALQHARGRGASEVVARARPAATPVAAPAAKPAEPVAEATPPREATAASVRVSMQQVDAIAAAAGEIAGLASALSARAGELGDLRARRRAGGIARDDDVLDADLTRLLRKADEDARALSAVSGRLGASARHLRQRPFSELTETLPRVARDVALDVGKHVRVVLAGGAIEADRVVLEALREPLLHLVRNAVDHGVELPAQRSAAGKPDEAEIRIEGALRGDRLQVTISDDGRGIDLDAVRRGLERNGRPVPRDDYAVARTIFDDGFSTRDTATTLSGRGVGLAIVRSSAERMGGTVDVRFAAGRGTTITIDVPISIATMRVVLVETGGVILGVPSAFVARVAQADPHALVRVDGREMLLTADVAIPITTLSGLLGPPFTEGVAPAMLQLVVLESGGRRLAVVVDDLLDECELVLRPLEHAGHAATNATVGTALLGGGSVALVLSVPALMDRNEGLGTSVGTIVLGRGAPRPPSRILVVDDSITSRTLEQSVLAAAGYDVITAVDGVAAWRILEREPVALVVSDVEMPQLDGIGLCERIRATEATATLPVILVTSLDQPAQRARGLEAGADAYITKSSFDQDTLLDTVRMLIGRDPGGVS